MVRIRNQTNPILILYAQIISEMIPILEPTPIPESILESTRESQFAPELEEELTAELKWPPEYKSFGCYIISKGMDRL